MPQLDRDWIITGSDTNGLGGWHQFLPASPNFFTLPSNSLVVGPLTSPRTIQSGSPQMMETNDDYMLEAIRGQILFTLDHTEAAAPWRGLLDYRFEVMDASASGFPAVPVDYDLWTTETANRAFLSHGTILYRREGTWLEPAQSDGGATRVVDVHIKSRRRISPNHVVALALQWNTESFQSGTLPRMQVIPRLRVLGSTRT